MAYFPMSQCRSTTQSWSAKQRMVTSVVQSGMRCMHSRILEGRRGVLPPLGSARVIVVVAEPLLRPGDAMADMVRAWIADCGCLLLFLQAVGTGNGPAFIQEAAGSLPVCGPIVG